MKNKFRFELESKNFCEGSENFLIKLTEITKLTSSDILLGYSVKYSLDVFISNNKWNLNPKYMLYSNTFDVCCDRSENFEKFLKIYKEICSDLTNYYEGVGFISDKEGVVYNYLVFYVNRY